MAQYIDRFPLLSSSLNIPSAGPEGRWLIILMDNLLDNIVDGDQIGAETIQAFKALQMQNSHNSQLLGNWTNSKLNFWTIW